MTARRSSVESVDCVVVVVNFFPWARTEWDLVLLLQRLSSLGGGLELFVLWNVDDFGNPIIKWAHGRRKQ